MKKISKGCLSVDKSWLETYSKEEKNYIPDIERQVRQRFKRFSVY